MFDDDDKDYYYGRAEAELTLAQAATHPAVVTAHFALAETYLDLVYGRVEPPAEQDGEPSEERRASMTDSNPDDVAPEGTPGTGENICRACGGSGVQDGAPCEHCGGTGKVIEGIGGA